MDEGIKTCPMTVDGMKDGIFFIIDDSNSRCGITDRLKAAVGLCYAARMNGLDFRFIHRAGFDIRDYLAPNRIPWSAEMSDLSDLPGEKREIKYLVPYTDLKGLKKGVQYVCKRYVGNNIMEKWDVPDWKRLWRDLFWDMFTPSDAVTDALKSCDTPERYTAVVVRFINSLGHAEDTLYNSPLPPDMQEKLIDAVLLRVAECEKGSDHRIVVYSDSARFLERARASGYMITDANGIGNIMNGDVGDYVILRTFVNMLQMAKAEKICSVLHIDGFPENSLYRTQYPRYAAIIGDRPFIRL